jgi:UDP-3-O-acyl-N-acetylglucosamine deacetylase
MRAAGLGKGATMQNTVIIDGDKALETTLRFSNEPVRHKILDLIGDLYVLGRPVYGHIEARCSGHRANRELAKKLALAH